MHDINTGHSIYNNMHDINTGYTIYPISHTFYDFLGLYNSFFFYEQLSITKVIFVDKNYVYYDVIDIIVML